MFLNLDNPVGLQTNLYGVSQYCSMDSFIRILGGSQVEKQKVPAAGKEIKIKVSSDKMEAFLVTSAGISLEPKEVFQALQDAGIVYGIDIDGIHHLCEELLVTGHFLVATGLESVPGQKAEITYKFNKPELKPETTEDGRVDFYNLGGIIQVKAGDILAERRPATEGTPGYNVLGEILNPLPGKQVAFQIAKGTKVIGDQVIAEFDGAVTWQGPKIGVARLQIVNGDTDFSVGNINYPGKVLINGWVKDGFIIEADDDVEIRGGMEDATVISRNGSVFIHQGVAGRGHATVKADVNVEARYIQEATVEAGNNIVVNEYVIRSNIKAGRSFLLQGIRGRILGQNQIIAGSQIKVNTIQANKDMNMVVEGIDRKKMYQQYRSLEDLIVKEEDQARELAVKVRMLAKDKNPDAREALTKVLPYYSSLLDKIEHYRDEREQIMQCLRSTKGDGMIEVKNKINDNTAMRIKDKVVELSHDMQNITMYYDTNERRIVVIKN